MWSYSKSLFVLSPHFPSFVSLSLQLLIRSQRGHECLRPVLPAAAGASPSPWLPTGFSSPLAHCTPSASGIRHSAQHSLAWVRCLHSSSPWDPALFLSFCFLLFMVLNPALRPCANALLLAKLNLFQGRLHKSSGLVLGARPAGLDVLFSRPRSCWRTCWHELPPKRSQQDALQAGRSQSSSPARSGTGFANSV